MEFVNKENQTTQSNKTQLSLAATMFFAPFVKSTLKNWHLELTKEDTDFINWYTRLWFINIGLLLLTLVSGISSYLTHDYVLNRVYLISIGILVWILVLSSILILANVKIFQWDNEFLHSTQISTNKSDILLSYLPIYNFYLWYKLHNFEKPYRWAKESILLWSIFSILSLIFANIIVSSFIITVIIIRIASLMSGIDVLDPHVKQKINKLYTQNTEEIWWYVCGYIKYIWKKISWKNNQTLKEIIILQKYRYQKLHIIKWNEFIQLQYIILMIGLWLWSYLWYQKTENQWVYYIPAILIFGKYILMAKKRKHLPPLPIINDIFGMFKRKKSNSNLNWA